MKTACIDAERRPERLRRVESGTKSVKNRGILVYAKLMFQHRPLELYAFGNPREAGTSENKSRRR
jgi:hypothetical protein